MDEGRTVCPIIFTSPSSLKWHVAGYQDVPEQQHPASLVHQTQSRGDSIVGVRDSARVMATKMPTVEARVLGHPDWGVELSRHQYDVEGIELKNEKMMTAIFQDLGIPEDDFRRQSQLRAYIKKHQANGKKSFNFVRWITVETFSQRNQTNPCCSTGLPLPRLS